MKKLAKSIYIIKLLLFAVNFYFMFSMLSNILSTNIYGIIFIVMYLIFAIKIIIEIIAKNTKYQEDIIYNIMQIGFIIYLLIISIKINMANVYVTRINFSYFKVNYIILSILILFILFYGFIETNNKPNVKQH